MKSEKKYFLLPEINMNQGSLSLALENSGYDLIYISDRRNLIKV